MRKLILFALILVSLPIYAQFGWYRQNSNSTNLVGGVHMFNDNKAIVVGFNGLVRTTTNGGTTVSYTHLDVYKRQGQYNEIFFFRFLFFKGN